MIWTRRVFNRQLGVQKKKIANNNIMDESTQRFIVLFRQLGFIRWSVKIRQQVAPLGLVTLFCAVLGVCPLAGASSDHELVEMSLEELLEVTVTSVTKTQSSLLNSPAAIFVISEEDIRRSGHTSLPELLRMVPGLNVARINGNEWAVTSRGFNAQYATKLLVLVDGRTVYSPMFSGVYWSAQDIMLENLERIEIIRGPGAALWGANAVNGVINIITKSARETQGGLSTITYGTEQQPSVNFRYGGQFGGDIFYRAYLKYINRRGFVDEPGRGSSDDWHTTRGGVRLDWRLSERDTLTMETEYYQATVGEYFERALLSAPFLEGETLTHDNYGGHVVGRWRRQVSDTSELMLQAYYDRFRQGDGDVSETRDTFDIEFQHQFLLGNRQKIVWGANIRHTVDELPPSFYLTFYPDNQRDQLYSLFLQDEITLVADRLSLTLGSKFEDHEATGLEVQPNIRLLWTPTERQAAWGAVSSAVRTPARYDRNSRLNAAAFPIPFSPPFLVSLFSLPGAEAEEMVAYELGYRVELTGQLSLDVTGFYNEYDELLAYGAPGPVVFETDPAPPHLLLPLFLTNSVSGHSRGGEIYAQWRVTDAWKLMAGYSWLDIRLHPDNAIEEESPSHQFHIRSYLDLPNRLQLNSVVYYVGGIETPLDNARVSLDSYLRVDLNLSWRPVDGLEIGLRAENLLDGKHAEFGTFKTQTLTEVPRNVSAQMTWRF